MQTGQGRQILPEGLKESRHGGLGWQAAIPDFEPDWVLPQDIHTGVRSEAGDALQGTQGEQVFVSMGGSYPPIFERHALGDPAVPLNFIHEFTDHHQAAKRRNATAVIGHYQIVVEICWQALYSTHIGHSFSLWSGS